MKKIAFTLAEVLLTLTIVGVVSALTVPNIIGAVDEKELQAQAKKAYNTLQTAINMQYAMTRKTPADVQETHLLELLMSGPDGYHGLGGQKVLKLVESDMDTWPWYAFLPDGQIIVVRTRTNYCTKTTPCQVLFDLNGADGPNFSNVNWEDETSSAGMTLSQITYEDFEDYATATTYEKRYRDIVFFEVAGMDVRPKPNHPNTRRYFMGRR